MGEKTIDPLFMKETILKILACRQLTYYIERSASSEDTLKAVQFNAGRKKIWQPRNEGSKSVFRSNSK